MMKQLPKEILAKLDEIGGSAQDYEALSATYRGKKPAFGYQKAGQQEAYITARMPATYGAVCAVLEEVPVDSPKSVLDLGAGPGTATIAAFEHFKTIETATLVEQDRLMSALSEKLCSHLKECRFVRENVLGKMTFNPHDLVLLSYVLNEHPIEQQIKIAERAWEATSKALIILTPGTPHHFQNLLKVRDFLIEKEAIIAAPCPSNKPCPLRDTPDWCHFSTRIERTLKHRQLKSGALMYEDEKFSYLVAVRSDVKGQNRLIKAPLHRKGHIIFDICTPNGLVRQTITQKDKEAYNRAKKLTWGMPMPESNDH